MAYLTGSNSYHNELGEIKASGPGGGINNYIYKYQGNLYRFVDIYAIKSNALEARLHRKQQGYSSVPIKRLKSGGYAVYYSRIKKVASKGRNVSALTTKGRTTRSKLGLNLFGVKL